MERKEDPEVLRMVVHFLRGLTKMTQAQFGTAAGMSQTQISQYELGKETPSDDALRRLAEVAGVSWPLVAHLRRFYAAFFRVKSRKIRPAEKTDHLPGVEDGLAVLTYLLEEEVPVVSEAVQEAEAQRFWQSAARMPRERWRRALEISPRASRNPAMARLLRQESETVAASDPAEAKELAEIAAWISERAERG